MFKNYQEVEKWFNENTLEKDYGIFIETNIDGENEVFYIYKYYGIDEDNPEEPLYVFDSVQLDGFNIITYQCGTIFDLFKNGAKSINIIAKDDVIFKLGGKELFNKYLRHRKLVKIIKEEINFDCINEEELKDFILKSASCIDINDNIGCNGECEKCLEMRLNNTN